MKFKYNDEEYKLGKKITLFTAPNGFGKTRIFKKSKESIIKNENMSDEKLNLSFEKPSDPIVPFYFSFDEIKSEGKIMNFNFLDKIYSSQEKTMELMIERILKELNNKINEDSLKKILGFRYEIVGNRHYKSFTSISKIEDTVYEWVVKYKNVSKTLIKYMKDNNFHYSQPLLTNDEFDNIGNPYKNYLYFSSKYFDDLYHEKFLQIYNFKINDIDENFYKFLENLPKSCKSEKVFTGILYYSFFIDEKKNDFKLLKSIENYDSFNTIAISKDQSQRKEDLLPKIKENWEKFGLPNSLSIEMHESDFKLNRDYNSLSKSEKYRIAFIAMYSLINFIEDQNIVLFLDDPFDSLDRENLTTLLPSIVTLSKITKKILIATHKINIHAKISRYISDKKMISYIFSKDNIYLVKNPKVIKKSEMVKYDFSENWKKGFLLLQRIWHESNDSKLYEEFNYAYYNNQKISLNSLENSDKAEPIQKEIITRLDKVAIFKIKLNEIYSLLEKHASKKTSNENNNFNDKYSIRNIKNYIKSNSIELFNDLFLNKIPSDLETFMNSFFYNRTMINSFSHNEEPISNILFMDMNKITKITDLADKAIKSIEEK